jgi:hypothetical protein
MSDLSKRDLRRRDMSGRVRPMSRPNKDRALQRIHAELIQVIAACPDSADLQQRQDALTIINQAMDRISGLWVREPK